MLVNVKIPAINMDIITFSMVVPMEQPILGRFMVGDIQNRLHIGPWANSISLPVDENVRSIIVYRYLLIDL